MTQQTRANNNDENDQSGDVSEQQMKIREQDRSGDVRPGRRFGRLEVVGHQFRLKGVWYVVVKCDCGQGHYVNVSSLRGGLTKSCGCLFREGKNRLTHGESRTNLYWIWSSMRERCNNKRSKRYSDYGGRGIAVCKEWNDSYQAFSAWARENGYRQGLSLDRIKNDGPYRPENCRWATDSEQTNNSRANHLLTYDGRTQTMAEWAKEIGINYSTLRARVNMYGWSAEKAITVPAGKGKVTGKRLIKYKGETQSMADWSRELGINYHVLEGRLNRYGWSVERALSTPVGGK